MKAVRVVPALDEGEDGEAGLAMGRESSSIEELAFEGCEEALAEGVVVAVAHRSHRGSDAGFCAPVPEGDGCVLAALVRMMDDVARFPLLEGLGRCRGAGICVGRG